MKQEHKVTKELVDRMIEIHFPFSGNPYEVTVMEMLDVMPEWIRDGDRVNPINPYRLNIFAGYGVVYSNHITCKVIDKSMEELKPNTLPNALAEMVLWLHQNNYISFTK